MAMSDVCSDERLYHGVTNAASPACFAPSTAPATAPPSASLGSAIGRSRLIWHWVRGVRVALDSWRLDDDACFGGGRQRPRALQQRLLLLGVAAQPLRPQRVQPADRLSGSAAQRSVNFQDYARAMLSREVHTTASSF